MLLDKDTKTVDGEYFEYLITTDDQVSLLLRRFKVSGSNNPVLCIHGWTSSGNMFYQREIDHFVGYCHRHGYDDVWVLENRLSCIFDYNQQDIYNLDDVAQYDYQPALDEIEKQTGQLNIHIISHCVGALTFCMSLSAGYLSNYVDQIKSLTCNCVSIVPNIKPWAKIKLSFGPEIFKYLTPIKYMDPQWAIKPGFSLGKLLANIVAIGHPETNNKVCSMLSFIWGSGRPALYNLENIKPETYQRLGELLGVAGFTNFIHLRKMVNCGEMVSWQGKRIIEGFKSVDIPLFLMTGADNNVFYNSQQKSFDRLNELRPNGDQTLKVFENYGHQDPFSGQFAHRDIFPSIVEFMNRFE